MPAHARLRRSTIIILALILAWPTSLPTSAATRTWIGGNVDWVDGGAATNWNPNDEPDADDEAIFNTANSVNLTSNNATNGLTMSGGIDLFTNEFDLTVDGLVQLTGAGTNLFIGEAAGSVDADDLTINADGTVELRGGTLTMNEEVGASLIDVNVGGNLIGHGTIMFEDAPGVLTTVLVNDGELTALSRGLTILSPPPVGTLQINSASGTFTRVDLDGAGEAGVVNVNRNQTIDLNIGFSDAFNGTMNLFQESHFNSLNAWTLAGGSLVVNNGFVDNPLPTPDVAAGTSYIEGGLLTQTGGTINVVDADGTLQLDVNFTMGGGSFTNSGTTIFNGTTSITTAVGYAPNTLTAQTIVNGSTTITDAAGNFNWDGPGAATTTVNGTGVFTVVANQIDTSDDVFGGIINLNDDADLGVSVAANVWTMAGTLNKNDSGGSGVSGSRVVISGEVNVNAGTLQLPSTTTTASANLDVAGLLILGAATEFGGGAAIGGTGTLQMAGTSTVTANTTINVATFDWDGLGTGTSHTINAGAAFTINSPTLDSDGDMDDPLNLNGSGSQLIVNGPMQWTATAAINANNAGLGTATIGGTSRLILNGPNADLNVNGNTTITAPLTFGASSSASIDAGFTLDATNAVTYAGGAISGLGAYSPGATNIVTEDSSITSSTFDFDGGSWTIGAGKTLTVNVVDYDTTATNAFDGTITLNDGNIDVTTGDATFVFDGTLNLNSALGEAATWDGEPLAIGNDAGSLDADVNASGLGNNNIATTSVVVNSDAQIVIAAGSKLRFIQTADVTFNSVNGGSNAEISGAGEIEFNDAIFVNETTTFNMSGGAVDLDGSDAIGDFINVDAPLTIKAATLRNFGKANGGGGTNTIDVDNNVELGVLTVNLDDPNDEWTLNGPGVMNLTNDNAEATLLDGSDVNVNGTLNVTGDVRSTARLDVAGTVNINTAGQPLRLAGGSEGDPNRLIGGTINGAGVGVLGADSGKALIGFGVISATVDFDGANRLFADDGTLTINGTILDVGRIGTDDDDGVLNVVNPWNTNVAEFVTLDGGVLQGGAMTVNNPNGVGGHGSITSRIINDNLVRAVDGTLILQTAGNDNDWDGAGNNGNLLAGDGDVLELRDNATFGFTGSVAIAPGGRVFANGFALDFNPGSSLFLNSNGTYQSTSSTDIGGVVTTSAGPASTIEVTNNFFLTFEPTSSTTLDANLRLVNNNINIEAGATFAGSGAVVIPDGSHLVADNLANIGVLLDMQGAFRPGNFEGIGRVDLFDYQQSNTAELFVELKGTALNAFDRLVASGDVVLDGYLNIDIDEISPGNLFVPTLGQTFNIITGNTVNGTFDYADVSGMPAGLAFHINYLANAVQLEVVNKPIFSADFDDDGDVDPTDLAIWKAAFNLNQLGDADGDNDSDGADFLLWQQQYGSAPAVAVVQPAAAAVPEPSAAALLLAAMALAGCRRTRR